MASIRCYSTKVSLTRSTFSCYSETKAVVLVGYTSILLFINNIKKFKEINLPTIFSNLMHVVVSIQPKFIELLYISVDWLLQEV